MLDDDLPTKEDEARFFAALGRAITAWADLEDVLFAITHTILDCTKERAAIVFYRTPTIASRLTLTDDLVGSFFPKHEPGEQPDRRIKRWNEIQSEISEYLPFRNRLAHHPVGPVIGIREAAGSEPEIEIMQATYICHSESLRRRKHPEPAGITEIRAHRQIVSRLVNDLRNFHRQEFRTPPQAPGETNAQPIPPQDHPSDQEEPSPQPGPSGA